MTQRQRKQRELVVVRKGQRVFNEIVAAYLRRLDFGQDGYARLTARFLRSTALLRMKDRASRH